MSRRYQVKELAALASVSVRTLHHYHDIGLLVPARRSPAGYREYDQDDLLRLQQILLHRALGFSLEDVRKLLDDPTADRRARLREQRAELLRRVDQLHALVGAVDAALQRLDPHRGDPMSDERLFQGFSADQHAAEAAQRWGQTESYREASARTKRYTPDDWARFREENDAILSALGEALSSGAPPDGERAMDVAERHRLSVDRWFYPCPHDMHSRLADLFESDARYVANIDKVGEGATTYLVAAIRANAERAR